MAQTVTIHNHRYEPSEVDIEHSEVLNVINESEDEHTLTGDDGTFDTGLIRPGEEVALEISSDVHIGANPFHCSLHEDMHGMLVVSPSEEQMPTTDRSMAGTGV